MLMMTRGSEDARCGPPRHRSGCLASVHPLFCTTARPPRHRTTRSLAAMSAAVTTSSAGVRFAAAGASRLRAKPVGLPGPVLSRRTPRAAVSVRASAKDKQANVDAEDLFVNMFRFALDEAAAKKAVLGSSVSAPLLFAAQARCPISTLRILL